MASTAHVLVVDDDEPIAASLRRALEYEGYRVSVAADGPSALVTAAGERPDLVVLDRMLPGIDGMGVCRRLRADDPTLLILMLTARDATADRVAGLDAGADDYLVKPFDYDELLARVRALLRRGTGAGDRLAFADVTLDERTREVRRGTRELTLTAQEHALLRHFMLNPRQVFTRAQLLDSVWGMGFASASNVVDVYVGYLRGKLEAGGEPRLLHTVRGVGYVYGTDMSIRLRITLFGLGVVSAVLAIFCLGMFLLLASTVGKTQDEALAARAEQAVKVLQASGPPPPSGLAPAAADPRVSGDIFVLVLDRTGALLSSTGGVDGAAPVLPRDLLAAADRSGTAKSTVDAAAGVPIRVHVRTWSGGYVVAAQTARRLQDDRRGLFVLSVVVAILGFCAAVGTIWLVIGQALRPLRQLTGLVDEIGRSRDLSRRLPPVSTRDDVGRLTASFNAMMARLQEANQRLASGLVAQQRFTADASHELRTPLTTIRNNAGFLLRHADAKPDDRAAAVRDIAGESERMSRLVDNLLTLARADAGQHLERRSVDLSDLVEEVCRQARAQHPDRQIHCAVTPAPPVLGERDALAQLLWILVDNAVKYTEANGNVWVAVTQRGDRGQLHVTDDGPGIPPGDEQRIFARFYRGDAARSGNGAGLGLSIAAWIVRAHGGTILAANNAHGGASFVAELPLSPHS